MDAVFDGQCGFCTRAVGWVRRMDRHRRITFHPFQDPLTLEAFRLSHDEARSSVWALTDDGARHRGARAISAILDTALGGRFFATVYRIPGVGRLQEAVYGWVAAHRYRLPGATPWCTEHPQDCADAIPGAGCAL